MGRKRIKADGESGQGRSPHFILYARVRAELGAALGAYLRDTRPRPTLTSAAEVMLEEFLAARGYWPWPVPESAD